jgi:SET domain
VLEPISLERKVKYLVVRGVHRLLSMYPYEGAGQAVDRKLDASVRETEQGLVVAASLVPGAGMGLFVDRDYEAGEVVCTYVGRCLTLLQMLRTRDWTYMMDCGKDRRGQRVHLDARHQPRSKAAYINHHFDRDRVNVVCDEMPDERKCLVLASRRILRGEELYMDYGLKYWHIVASPPTSSPARGSALRDMAAARARG